ncbi:MAG: response regulator [Spirochaetaceae bacterium]
MSKKILVIDDEQIILDSIEMIFEDLGYSVSCQINPLVGESIASKEDFDLILVDLNMPIKDGLEITRSILSNKSEAKILIITANISDPRAVEALNLGAIDLVGKPFEIGKILNLLRD